MSSPEAPAYPPPVEASPATWVEEHGDYLYRFALARVRDPEVAEDLVQETFAAAIRSKSGFASRSSLRTWLGGILKHKIIDYFRDRSRTVLASDLAAGEAGGEPADEAAFFDRLFDRSGHWRNAPREWSRAPSQGVEAQELRRVLADCLTKLPAPQARAFALREIEEMPSEEVMKAMKMSPNNLYVTLHRARLKLRECLDQNYFGRVAG